MDDTSFLSLRLKDKILLAFLGGLALGEEILENLPTPRDSVRGLYTSKPKERTLGRSSLRRIFLRALEEKLLEKEKAERGRRYNITQAGFDYLYKKFPLLRLCRKKFDGSFVFVIYDVAETERKLRRQIRDGLKSLGFKMIQQSVWASPLDLKPELEELFNKLKLQDKALILRHRIPFEKAQAFLRSYWGNLLDEEERFLPAIGLFTKTTKAK